MASRKKYYAVAKGNTKGIFTSWSMCRKSVDYYQGALYKGFSDIELAINFMVPYSFHCCSIPVFDDVGNMKSVKEYGHDNHTPCSSESELTSSRNMTKSTHEDEDTDSDVSQYEDLPLEETVIQCDANNSNDTEQTFLKVTASDENLCNVCHLEETDCMIPCHSCSKQTHYLCTDLPPYALYTLKTSQQSYTCQKCVAVPEEFLSILSVKPIKADLTPNESKSAKYDTPSEKYEQESNDYIDIIASRFQETIISSMNTLDGGTNPKYEANFKLTQEKMTDLEHELKKGVNSIQLTIKTLIEDRIKVMTDKIYDKIEKNSVKIDQIHKELKTTENRVENQIEKTADKSSENPYLIENVEKCCMTIPIISNSTKDMPAFIQRGDQKFEELDQQTKQNTQLMKEHSEKLEKISDTLDKLSISENKLSYACSTKNRFDILNENSLFDQNNQDVDKLFDKESEEINYTLADLHDSGFTPVSKKVHTSKQSANKENVTSKLKTIPNNSKKLTPEKASTNKTDSTSRSSYRQKKILLLGNSHLRPIRTFNFLRGCSVDKELCYTVEKAEKYIEINNVPYDCIVLHLFTNDVKNSDNTEATCSKFEKLVQKIHEKHPDTKVVFSLGICRGDSNILNNKIQECNIILQHLFMRKDYIILCDNSTLGYRGQANRWFLKHDQVHLNFKGVKVFVANLKHQICKAMKIKRVRHVQNSPQNHWGDYNGYW